MQDFDKLWNYNDPAATELKFREVLNATSSIDTLYKLELLTQLARTYSLRRLFNEAHNILDDVQSQMPAQAGVVHIRYNLERGRTYNSSGKKNEAKPYFEESRRMAEMTGEDAYAIDAIHMLAIVAGNDEAIKLNEEAVIKAESSDNPQARQWLGSLYNNLGWSYFDKGLYEIALSLFLRALKFREEQKSTTGIFLAKWCVARTLRALGRLDNALTIQLGLFEESVTSGHSDGYVHEEIGELYLLKNDKQKASFHFEKAYQLLSADSYMQEHETARLNRIKSYI
jgi:tetratricopeptide (TPR) repeat protein